LNTGFNLRFTVELILRVMVEGLLFFLGTIHPSTGTQWMRAW
jgi:hypothetical protein